MRVFIVYVLRGTRILSGELLTGYCPVNILALQLVMTACGDGEIVVVISREKLDTGEDLLPTKGAV